VLFYRLQRVLEAGGWSPASERNERKHFGGTGRDGRQAAEIKVGRRERSDSREAD
jgi:hypothetical protein